MTRRSIVVFAMAALTTTASALADLTNGLVAYWKFDEGQSNIAHDSIGQNHGTIYGASWTSTGPVGSALDFDGAGDYVAASNNSSQQMTTNQITLSARIKLSAEVGNTQTRIICKQALVPHNTLGWGLEIFGAGYGGSTGNQLVFHDSNGSAWYNCLSPTHLNPFQWYHVAVTDNAGLITMYVDGQKDHSSGSGLGIPSAIDAPIHIGATNPADRYFFNGTIDRVRIYNRVLSGTEIVRLAVFPSAIANAGGPYFLAQDPIVLAGLVEGAYTHAAWDLNADGSFDDAVGLNPLVTTSMVESWGFSSGMTWDIGLQVMGLSGEIDVSMTELTYAPVPGALILGTIGITLAGWLLRRRRML